MIKKAAVITLLTQFLFVGSALFTVPSQADDALIQKGKELAVDRKMGNCLACHVMDNGSLPGNQGPPLVAMQARFPDKAKLKAQIFNPLELNPDSIMPPFGLHNILSDEEIDAVVEYLLTL